LTFWLLFCNLGSITKRGIVLYITSATSILGNLNHKRLANLFRFIGALFLFMMATTVVSSLGKLFSDTMQLLIVISLLLFLLGMHIHFFMVRSGHVPHAVPRPKRTEFELLVDEILHHDEFVKLKDFTHHTSHIYDHVVRVAFLSYSVAKLCGLDHVAAARGGLLHDFFLYDWRERKANDTHRSLHGKEHPHIALENAKKHFAIDEREADIIVKHMYPKTKEAPLYAESLIVSLMDKVAALYEYLIHALRHLKRMLLQ